jgi:hypothetical protein
MEIIDIHVPNDLQTEATSTKFRIWEKKLDEYVKRYTILEQNIKKTYSLICGQGSDIM